MSELVARVCSAGADRAALVEAGNAIAAAIYADPAGESVTNLSVSAWVPSGEHLDRDPAVDSITTDFELYLCDAEPDRLSSNWR